jgi:hypothetical protein
MLKEVNTMNKTLRGEYKIASKEVQDIYYYIFNGGPVDDIKRSLQLVETLPILNKEPVKIRNRKGHLIGLIGIKGSLRKFNSDFNKGCWYFDGNRVGKRKQLLIDAFFTDAPVPTGLNEVKVWNKIQYRLRANI